MWALILVTFAVADPPNARFNPVYFSQEYSSQERCEAAKSELRRSFVEKVDGLNRILADKEDAGEVRDYERIHVEIVCTQK
jgi:hypothetical protein